MFTGIVETVGRVKQIKKNNGNIEFVIESDFSNELKIDQSVSHNGVCLTVTEKDETSHNVTAIDETLAKTNLSDLEIGSTINLERCMVANGRFDGHIVQGHVDQVVKCVDIKELEGSWVCRFKFEEGTDNLLVEKGSITVNGVSLTCFDVDDNHFSVAIIPFTYENTTFNGLNAGFIVNIEFDIIGKYVSKLMNKN